MLETSFGLTFFLKTPEKPSNIRFIYLRITVDGVPKEKSTKRKWDVTRWDQKTERAIGTKEDARALNLFLDTMTSKINQIKLDMMCNDRTITSQRIMDSVLGKTAAKAKVLEEFQLHNDQMLALVAKKEFAIGTHVRYKTTKDHVANFIKFKFNEDDIEFRELNYQFAKDFEFYLRTVRNCSNNTALKYISNFKKVILRAVDKEIIPKDPFKAFKGKKNKTNKKPMSSQELYTLENFKFSTDRLSEVRDVFVFQCYTGLAYIDAFQLKRSDIKTGIDGERWIMSERQKTGSETNIPLLPKAIQIMDKYKDHPICLSRGTVLPVKSNQKMNEYLKEISTLCAFVFPLNTHKARRTFGSTVTLNNDVPIHVVKEMLGHASVKQTEEYALTEQKTIGRTMKALSQKLEPTIPDHQKSVLDRLEREISEMKEQLNVRVNEKCENEDPLKKLERISEEMQMLKDIYKLKAS